MLDILVILFMVVGLFFFFGTTIGILRFPDFYCRTHAAGKGDNSVGGRYAPSPGRY